MGLELLARSYEAALDAGYLWHEFGDSHLILP
jgi:S-adenosylmethionine:tRNA ribosyltransferase-isomerase